MGKNKFYAVAHGRKPGIYAEWYGAQGAEIQIRGFAAAVFKGFTLRRDAEEWLVKMSSGAGVASSQEVLPVTRAVEAKPADQEHPAIQPPAAGQTAIIYTDGGCSRNPGRGGYGIVLMTGAKRKELSGGYAQTTNNRMELLACIKGLEALEERTSVTLYSDSQYVVNGITKGWARRWRRNNWMRNEDEPAVNSDLWSRLLDLCEKHQVRFQWVRGHNGNPENERCDMLAVEMSRTAGLPPDPGYGGK